MISNLNLNQYKIFYCVASTGNISRASELLYISQPAISKSVSKLEENLGTVLFMRNHRGVILTEEGKILYDSLKTAFSSIDYAESRIKQNSLLEIGNIRISASATLCRYILIPYLNEFVKKYPHIKITIECQSSVGVITALEKNTIDIGLAVRPQHGKSIDFFSLGEIEDIFVASQAYIDNLKLRENTGELLTARSQTEIFSKANLMMLDKMNLTRKHVDSYLNENKIEATHAIEIDNMELLVEFAKIGLGIGCVIKEFIEPDIINGSLIQIPLMKPVPKREIGFIHMNNTTLNSSARKFIDFYKEAGNLIKK
ncbi:MAG: LysR family transcriptional regulator [Oscillospiraceae bacterium]|nr:LysR family transcriptional regulator [Oscillospiraceae bacterium]